MYRPDVRQTLFVVAENGSIGLCPDWRADGVLYTPINPANNLLRHAALLMPSEPLEFQSLGDLIHDIETYIRRYASLSADALGICAAYVLLTWVYDAFNELPYLRFHGEYGTGKTRLLLVVGSLCYKTFFASGASTISPIFHALDTFRGTLVFDEADCRLRANRGTPRISEWRSFKLPRS